MVDRKHLKRLIFAWLAVTAAIAATACSKSETSRTNSPSNPTLQPPRIKESPEANELDRESSRSQIESRRRTRSSQPGVEVVDLNPTGKTPEEIFGDQDAALPRERPSLDQVPPGTVIMNPAPVSSRPSTRPPGGSVDGNLFYSGSGQDSLYEDIKRIARSKDRAFATTVGFSSFEINWKNRGARLTVNLERTGKKAEEVVFTGKLNKAGLFSAASGSMQADAVCMDDNGGCNTVHVRLKKSGRVAHVIVRATDVWIWSDGEAEGSGNNVNYDRFIHILLTSATYPGGASSITAARLNTSETINGSSSFVFGLQMNMSVSDPSVAQAVSWTGPLLKSVRSDDLNVAVEQYAEYNPWGRRKSGAPQLARTIRESRLVRNDGRGNLQIDVTFAKISAASREQTARITVARIHEPTRALTLK